LTVSVKATAIGIESPCVSVSGLGPLEEAKLSSGVPERGDSDDQLSLEARGADCAEEPASRNHWKRRFAFEFHSMPTGCA